MKKRKKVEAFSVHCHFDKDPYRELEEIKKAEGGRSIRSIIKQAINEWLVWRKKR